MIQNLYYDQSNSQVFSNISEQFAVFDFDWQLIKDDVEQALRRSIGEIDSGVSDSCSSDVIMSEAVDNFLGVAVFLLDNDFCAYEKVRNRYSRLLIAAEASGMSIRKYRYFNPIEARKRASIVNHAKKWVIRYREIMELMVESEIEQKDRRTVRGGVCTPFQDCEKGYRSTYMEFFT
nr:hypothetical protein 2 [Candidatus Hydrogenedentota bacterium]